MAASSVQAWEPPVIDISKPLTQVGTIELDSCCRSAKWCSDGNTLLTMNEDRCLDMYKIENESQNVDELQSRNTESDSVLRQIGRFRQGSPIYETLWYPFATPTNPASHCFLTSIRDTPVRLLDANDGRLRASYRIVDHRERFVAPHSMAFNGSAESFYCGYLDAIEVFDLNYPGNGTRLLTRPTKKSKDGLRGIISALEFCPDYSGLFAAGTFNGSIGLFSEETGGQVLIYLDGVPGPVSQLKFHPTNPNLLFCACRRQEDIVIWDVRNRSTLHSSLNLDSSSNQRRRFDIDASGRWLVAGDEAGWLNYYDLNKPDEAGPVLRFQAHSDAISTAAFHPTKPYILTVSGSRKFPETETLEEAEVTNVDVSSDNESLEDIVGQRIVISKSRVDMGESIMKLWKA